MDEKIKKELKDKYKFIFNKLHRLMKGEELPGVGIETDIKQCIDKLIEINLKLLRAMELADGIIDFCGGGDSYERECTANERHEFNQIKEEIDKEGIKNE